MYGPSPHTKHPLIEHPRLVYLKNVNGATIMPGIQIGDSAIVAAMSVVTGNVEPYTIVGGNPAHSICQRFEPEVIQELLKIRWLDWEIEKITRNLKAICGHDIQELTEK